MASNVVSDKDFIAAEETFILDPRRFNVTLTRARMKFILMMSRSLLDHLPADKQTAESAADVQLFVEGYCESIGEAKLPDVSPRPSRQVTVLGRQFSSQAPAAA